MTFGGRCSAGASIWELAAYTLSVAVLATACGGGDHNDLPGCPPSPAKGSISVMVGATSNVCPVVAASSDQPASTNVGGSVKVTALASDPDSVQLVYTWSALAGTFEDPHAVSTKFKCAAAGLVTLTASVSDGQCTNSSTTPVLCTP